MTKKAHVIIGIVDVIRAGGVKQAILDWAEASGDTASGVIGPEFSTSGPGSGWSKTHGTSDFARRALGGSYGASYYLDAEDGRLAQLVDDDRPVEWAGAQTVGEYRESCLDCTGDIEDHEGNILPDDAIITISDDGTKYCIGTPNGNETWIETGSERPQKIDWSEASVVRLCCPSIEDAVKHPAETVEMALAVIGTHAECSDEAEWRWLIESIRVAARAMDDIDTNDLRY